AAEPRAAHPGGAAGRTRHDGWRHRRASRRRGDLMEVSDVRKRVKEVIDRSTRAMAERRTLVDEATREYQVFLDRIATPLLRQIGNVLRAEGHPFTVSTPGNSVSLTADTTATGLIDT